MLLRVVDRAGKTAAAAAAAKANAGEARARIVGNLFLRHAEAHVD